MGSEEENKSLDEIISKIKSKVSDMPSEKQRIIRENPVIAQRIVDEYQRSPSFAEQSKHDDETLLDDAIVTIFSRMEGKIVIFGSREFKENVTKKLWKLGFNVSERFFNEFMQDIAEEEQAIMLVEKDSQYHRQFEKQIENEKISAPVMFTGEDDFKEINLVRTVSVLDKKLVSTKAAARGAFRDVVIIDKDNTGKNIVEALKNRGVAAKLCATEEEASNNYSSIPFRVNLDRSGIIAERKTGLNRAEKQFFLNQINNRGFKENEIFRILRHIREGKPIIDLRTWVNHIRGLRNYRNEQYIMRAYALYKGDIGLIRTNVPEALLDGKGDADIREIAEKNALLYYLNKGTHEDLHGRLMSRAFGEGYSDLFFGTGKKIIISPDEIVTDDEFANYMLQHVIDYMTNPDAGIDSEVLTKDELEALKSNIRQQIGIDEENEEAKISMLQNYLDDDNGDSRQLYMRISFEKMIESIGGIKAARKKREILGKKIRDVVKSCIDDETFGPGGLTNLVKKEYRVKSPGRNPVFKVEVNVLDMGSIDAFVKIFDFRKGMDGSLLNKDEQRRKKEEFRKEMEAADYYSRWGINKAVHFFFEEYDEFGAIMMRYWGERNLHDIVGELNEMIRSEETKGEYANPELLKRWRSKKDTIFKSLMRKMAEVHALSPSKISKISEPTEDFKESIEDKVFGDEDKSIEDMVFGDEKEGKLSILWQFGKYGSEELYDEVKSILKNIRRYSRDFASYLHKAPNMKTKVAGKDAALRNWFLPGFIFGAGKNPNDLQAIDYGSIRNLPPTMDVGNAFVMADILSLDDILKYSGVYYDAYEKEVNAHNRKMDKILANLPNEVKKQFVREDLCRKSARKYLKDLSEFVKTRVERAFNSDKIGITQDGRIKSRLKKEIDSAFSLFIKEASGPNLYTQQSKIPPLSDEDRSYLKMFKDNVVRFFRALQYKEEDCWGGEPEQSSEERFSRYWEGMLASMAYKTMRNLRAYTIFIKELDESLLKETGEPLGRYDCTWDFMPSQINPALLSHKPQVMIAEAEEIIEAGMVSPLEEFLKIYESRLEPKSKQPYSKESYENIRSMTEELRNLARCFGKLKTYKETMKDGETDMELKRDE